MGQSADLDRLKQIANKHNLILVERCSSGAIWPEYKGKPIGGLTAAGFFPLLPAKKSWHIRREGGAVTTNDEIYTNC